METFIDFESDLFAPYLPDDAQVNPGVFGAELTFWLSRQLALRGVMTSYPAYEDWGWFIEYRTEDGHEYWLRCTNRDEARDKWRCHLEPKAKGLFGRNKAPVDAARPLLQALREVLAQEPAIGSIDWKA